MPVAVAPDWLGHYQNEKKKAIGSAGVIRFDAAFRAKTKRVLYRSVAATPPVDWPKQQQIWYR